MNESDQDYPPTLIPQEAAHPAASTPSPTVSSSMAIGAYFWDVLETVVFALAIFIVVYLFIAQPHQVSGSSMYPNFIDREYILTNKVTYHFSQPARGDVVVFRAPPDPTKDYIKRIIGLPGETFKVDNGHVYINDHELPESYLANTVTTPEGIEFHNGEEIKIPQDDYVVLGDNRPASSDSRDWGFMPKANIIGKALFVYWPLNRAGLVPKVTYSLPSAP